MTRYALHDQVRDELILVGSPAVAARLAESGYDVYELVPIRGGDLDDDLAERRDAVGAESDRDPRDRRPWLNRSY